MLKSFRALVHRTREIKSFLVVMWYADRRTTPKDVETRVKCFLSAIGKFRAKITKSILTLKGCILASFSLNKGSARARRPFVKGRLRFELETHLKKLMDDVHHQHFNNSQN